MPPPSQTWRAWTSRATVGFTMMFLIVAVVMIPLAWFQMKDAALLARDGIDTRGVVIDRHVTTNRRNTGATTETYYLTLRFTDAQDQTRTAHHSVSHRVYDDTHIGTAMAMRYAASDPTVTEFEAGKTRSYSALFGTIGAVSAVASVIFAWVLVASLRSQRRAAQIGERRMAKVTELVRNDKKHSKYYFVHWQAGDLSGNSTPQHLTRLPALGDEIPVYIDPRNGRGWWEGEY